MHEHYFWAPLRTGKKRAEDRQEVEVERKEVGTKKKERKTDIERRGISRTSDRS